MLAIPKIILHKGSVISPDDCCKTTAIKGVLLKEKGEETALTSWAVTLLLVTI